MFNLFIGGIATRTLLPVLVSIALPRTTGEVVTQGITVQLTAGFARGLLRAGRCATGMFSLFIGGVATGAFLPVLIGIALPGATGKVVTLGITVQLTAGFARSLLCAGRCATGMFSLSVGGIATGTFLPVLIGIALPRVTGKVVTEGIAVQLTASFARGLFRTGRCAAGMFSLSIGSIATGTLLPVLVSIALPRTTGEVVAKVVYRFRFRCMACRTREGFLPRHRASGLCRHFSVVPHVIGFRVGGIAT